MHRILLLVLALTALLTALLFIREDPVSSFRGTDLRNLFNADDWLHAAAPRSESDRTTYAPYQYLLYGMPLYYIREYRARLQLRGITPVTPVTAAGCVALPADLARWERHNARVEEVLIASTGNPRIWDELRAQARADRQAGTMHVPVEYR